MSKLAHSNDETMYEIEMNAHGLSAVVFNPPKCQATIRRQWYHSGPTPQCPFAAKWTDKHGRLYCKKHAEQEATESLKIDIMNECYGPASDAKIE